PHSLSIPPGRRCRVSTSGLGHTSLLFIRRSCSELLQKPGLAKSQNGCRRGSPPRCSFFGHLADFASPATTIVGRITRPFGRTRLPALWASRGKLISARGRSR